MSGAVRRLRLAANDVREGDGLAPFPLVSDRDYRQGRSCDALWDRWRDAPMRPLRVTARMAAGYVPTVDGYVHLDAVLGSALLNSFMVGPTVGHKGNVVVPLPLRLVWTSPEGWPMWAATDLRPAGHRTAEIYIHKRHPGDRAPLAAQTTVNTSAGRYKDVRLPLRVDLTPELVGWCLGDRGAVEVLLRDVEHLGRKASIGQGRVLGWTVEPADVDLDWILDRRSVPMAYLSGRGLDVPPSRLAPRASWTAPYWDATRHAPCRVSSWMP